MPGRISTAIGGASVVALTVGLASACGSSGSGGSSGSSKKTMELIVGTKSDDFYVTMECGAEKEAKKLGVKLTVTGPATFSVPQQKPLIDAAQVSKPDALLIAPTDSSALDPDLQKVVKGGTKLIFVDTIVAIEADDTLVLRVKPDNVKIQVTRASVSSLVSTEGKK